MNDTDKKDSLMTRVFIDFARENKRKRRLRVASGVMGLAASIVIAVVLVAPGFAADSLHTTRSVAAGSSNVITLSDSLVPLSESADTLSDAGGAGEAEHGRAYRVGFRYTYDGVAGESAFLRFRPIGKYANSITVNGEEVFCIQYLSYVSAAGAGDMLRLSHGGSDDFYYYPHPLRIGDTVAFLYTLYTQREISAESLNKLAFEILQTSNSASAVRWNVVFEDGMVSPLDNSTYGNGEYHIFDVTFAAPEETPTPAA